MIIKGRRGEYWAITWADGFDPSLHDLLPLVPEAVLGRRVLIASIDSGQFKPTPDELNDGWSMQGQQAVSPLIEALSVLPAVGFDEWYVYEGDVPREHHKAFVNGFGFSPLDPGCVEAAEFWEQVAQFRPLHVLGAGTPTMFLVTRDERIYAQAEKVQALP
jgi:hypothetical protein